MIPIFTQLKRHKYLNIETFRKNGTAVRTPVWFVQDDQVIYIRTGANSGKVKRIRTNPMVNIAPCRMDGTPVEDWIHAIGRELCDPAIDRRVDQLLDKKYGLIKKLFSLNGKREGFAYTILELKVRK